MAQPLAQVFGTAAAGGFFYLGLRVFQGRIRLNRPSRPSPGFERWFPKLWGGVAMTLSGIPLIGTAIRLLF